MLLKTVTKQYDLQHLVFNYHKAIAFCNCIFHWLHFICKIVQIMHAQAALLWKCFNELLKSLKEYTTEELKTFQQML